MWTTVFKKSETVTFKLTHSTGIADVGEEIAVYHGPNKILRLHNRTW